MATLIEKNTKKLIERKLDVLFAEQQKLNGDAGGNPEMATGGYGPGDPENMTPWFPSSENAMGALEWIRNRNTPNYYAGQLPGVTVTGVRGYKNSQSKPFQVAPITVTAERPTFWSKTGINPYNHYGNTNLPKTQNTGQNVMKVNINGPIDTTTPEQAGFTNPSTSNSFASGSNVPYNPQTYGFDPGYAYTAPQTYDTVDTSLSYGTNEARRNASGPNFSNPLDDPNSKLFDPAKSKANTLKEAGINKPNWGKVGTFAMQAAPMLYNMFKGLQRPDKVTPNYNPYEGDIRNAMRNRRFNVDPTLNANRVAQAVSNRNIRSAANSRGELMGNLGAAQNYRMAGDAAAYAQKNNMDNQYLAEQAQMDAQLGSQRAQMDWMTQTAQAQNKAATNSFLGQGFNDLGEFSQVQQQMKNQKFRDAQLAGLYPDMYSQIYQFQPFMQSIVNAAKAEGRIA